MEFALLANRPVKLVMALLQFVCHAMAQQEGVFC